MRKLIMRSLLRLAFLGALVFCAPLAAMAQQPAASPQAAAAAPTPMAHTPQATAVDSSYLLGPGDVVESCVNHVGVELNTASAQLLG